MGSPESRTPNGIEVPGRSRAARVYSRARGFITRRPASEATQAVPLDTRNTSTDIQQQKIQSKARTVAVRQKEGQARTPHALAVKEAMIADRKRASQPIASDARINKAFVDYMRLVNDVFVSKEITEFAEAMRTNFTRIKRDALEMHAFVQPNTGSENSGREFVYSFALVPTGESEEEILAAAKTANAVTRAYLESKHTEYDHTIADQHYLYYEETTFEDAGPSHQGSILPIENCYHVIPSGNGRLIEIAIANISSDGFASIIDESVLIHRAEPYTPLFQVK